MSPLPAASPGASYEVVVLRTSRSHLRDEILLVRAGRAGTLVVLDNEIACVEQLADASRSLQPARELRFLLCPVTGARPEDMSPLVRPLSWDQT